MTGSLMWRVVVIFWIVGLVFASGAHAQHDWWKVSLTSANMAPDNGVFTEMIVDDLWLVAGTYNVTNGFELWAGQPSGDSYIMYQVEDNGFGDAENIAVTSLCATTLVTNDLYVGTLNQTTGGEVWVKHSAADFTQIGGDGLGDSNNRGIYSMAVYDDLLWVGTSNSSGAEIHTWTGSAWQGQLTGGLGNPNNTTASAMVVHAGALYVAFENTLEGAEIWRTTNGSLWTPFVEGGLGGAAHITALVSLDGTLFAAAPNNAGLKIYALGEGFALQVNQNGFGNAAAQWPMAMTVHDGKLHVGTGTAVTGAQVWRMNAAFDWNPVLMDGFGTTNNTDASSLTSYDGLLWAGTANWTDGSELWRTGAIFVDDFETGDPLYWSAVTQ